MGSESIPAEGLFAIVAAGFGMGIAGSLHCISMCGPLVAAVFHAKKGALGLKLLYNGGRILTYVLLGSLTGILGYLLNLTEVQKFISLVIGIMMAVFGLFGFRKLTFSSFNNALGKLTNTLKQYFSAFLQKHNVISNFFMGVLNGFLPCGLTYMALTYTLTLQGSATAGLFMFSFGAGTLPAMVGVPILVGALGAKYHNVIKKFNALILIAIGVLLIWRSYMQFNSGMDGPMH